MRQEEGDYIAELCDTTRFHIDGDQDLQWMSSLKRKFNTETGKGYSFTNEDKVIKSFINNYHDGVDCRITAYRNTRINYLNETIRKSIFGEKAETLYLEGDLIVGNDIYNPTDEPEAIFYNGEDMIITFVTISIVCEIKCWEIWVKNKDMPIYVVHDDDLHKYKSKIAKLKAEGIRTKLWGDYMQYKGRFANISYGYAVTLYKIQGTTLKGVYVDISDIFGVKPLTPKRKLQSLYVGFSRPQNFLAMF